MFMGDIFLRAQRYKKKIYHKNFIKKNRRFHYVNIM